MADEEFRKERLNQVIDLARIYRGWTKGELANALGRDASNMMPESGNPKLDLVFGLAEVLDWPVGDVAESLCRQDEPRLEPGETYPVLSAASLAAHKEGRYDRLFELASKMLMQARTSRERAQAALRLAGAYDGLGRYTKALEWMQAAVSEPNLHPASRALILANLANAHYSVWHLIEARAIAWEVLEPSRSDSLQGRPGETARALAHYVYGQASRRMIPLDSNKARFFAAAAKAHLEASEQHHLAMAGSFQEPKYSGVANTCRGGIIEASVELGELSPNEGVRLISDGLEQVVDVLNHPKGDWLESWGWWAIFGCNIALRHLAGDDLHLNMAIFTNKAMEIADRQNNWAMRERAFTLEHFRRLRVSEAADLQSEWVLDLEDIRTLAGTMGRFPQFRPLGWEILKSARVVER